MTLSHLELPERRPRLTAAQRMLQIETIYYEPAAIERARGREVLDRFPGARKIEVASHRDIPGLYGNEGRVREWVRTKRSTLVLGIRKTLPVRVNGRSADFIAPGQASGCAMACAYCYVPRHKGFANPITLFVNVDEINAAIAKHSVAQGFKWEPSQTDPELWVYDIGENSDCSVDALLSDNIKDQVAFFRTLPGAKATWATKFINRALLDYDPQGKTRIRFSLMPASVARVVDVRTSPMAERIAAVNDFVEAGYEVHLNLSPVIVTENWLALYAELFEEIDAALSPRAKAQLAAECIFLTHNEGLHRVNLGWHPRGEDLLWRPDLQEPKRSEMGGINVRYRTGMKGRMVSDFAALLAAKLPYCRLRYAF
ncbi:spore photoproduct lyase family protein [Capsulimonas corticalis]|uniref:Spore photoproduct lyase family protein n=2 Tax=Capsulimonas corticalis TaxID=2219043 RepID=A0A402CW39_9BACT|nr:spore photoproduct lyase family protein [Capsulimonas corticalis]BDI34030.1 spore photoproduct lyase family protein [Capsulimonas corticalis]